VDLAAVCNGTVRHGSWNGDRESKVQVVWDDIGNFGAQAGVNAIAVDPGGRLHLLLWDSDKKELDYLLSSQSIWSSQTLRTNFGGVVFGALDPDANLAYCWQDSGAADGSVTAACARLVSGKWAETMVVENVTTSFNLVGMAVGADGKFRLVALAGPDWHHGAEQVVFLEEQSGGFKSTTIASFLGEEGLITSQPALDSKDVPYVAVSDGDSVWLLSHAP
jgi:hypothetical protein